MMNKIVYLIVIVALTAQTFAAPDGVPATGNGAVPPVAGAVQAAVPNAAANPPSPSAENPMGLVAKEVQSLTDAAQNGLKGVLGGFMH